MKAVNNYLVVDKIKTEPKKIAGLIMTEQTDLETKYVKAKVVSIGNLVEGIKDNDVVYYNKHAGHVIEYDEKLYYIIKTSDIVLID